MSEREPLGMKQRDIYTYKIDELVWVPERSESMSTTNNKSTP